MPPVTSTLFKEILRPKSLDQAILTKRVRDQLTNELTSQYGLISNVLLFGGPGQGKTTLSRILAHGHDTKVINCSETGIDAVREDIQMFAAQMSLDHPDNPIKVVLLEECDGFTVNAWQAMRATVEKFADTVRFVANCNYIEKIPDPIKSRFTCIQLEPINQEEREELWKGYYERCSALLTQLGISFTEENLDNFLKMWFPDFRSILNGIQQLHIRGIKELTTSSFASSFDYEKMFDFIVTSNNPWDTYKIVRDEYGEDVDDAIVQIGLKFPEYIRAKYESLVGKIPMVVIAIAEHQDMLPRAINKKIVLESLIFKIQTILRMT